MSGSDKDLEEKYLLLDRVIDRYNTGQGQLIRILQEAQNIFGDLPEEVQAYIAGKTDIPVSEVSGVVTIYSLFSTSPRGKYGINVCLGTACYVQGSKGILDDFRRDLGLQNEDSTGDGLFTVKSTRCIGACGLAPVIIVNDEVHGRLSRKEVPKILRKYRKIEESGERQDDQRVERPSADQEGLPASP
ncbi:MAG: NADH-quinone oxidoreductase subunit NuoE family protein [Desulfocucumaceae bacterium]